MLISAYTDLEFTTRVSAALGEIYAETLTHKQVVCPDTTLYKQPNGKTARRISLLVGEKRWNIFANGGNLEGKCDKITKIHMLTLPGGFEIPVGLEITELSGYDLVKKPLSEETAQAQTFHTMEGLSDKKGVSFESVLMPGQYLTLQDGKLVLTDGSDKKAATFYLN